LTALFSGLPGPVQVLFWVALAVIVAVDVWVCVLFVCARRAARRQPAATAAGADAFTWVFLVPALDEELTIRDSVTRLVALPLERRHIVVVDDASGDRTPEILAELGQPGLHVVRRELPHARQGKAAALNHAFRRLGDLLGEVDRDSVIVAVVDADGRLAPEAPAHAAAHFADGSVGGVQSLVRIYNRQRLLTWCQDVEFSVYGHLYQAGRNGWGTAGMGGNGQFNRLSALDDVADGDGPWRDRLTEDQDLGLRLIVGGWKGRQDLRATVDQQGLSSIRALFRQRTRWSQGNLQALGLVDDLVGARLAAGVRLEQVAYLLMPLWQGIIGASFVTALVLMALGVAPFWDGGPSWQLLVFWVLAFGGTVLGCVAARAGDGPRGWLVGFLVGHVYVLYTWFLWPVLFRSTARQLAHRRDWSKTRREPLGPEPAG
jgi:cellulose synthase/poly-beta-1,6-N-acetylglucosamine synthase-like glycosyltransferase